MMHICLMGGLAHSAAVGEGGIVSHLARDLNAVKYPPPPPPPFLRGKETQGTN